MFNSGHFRFGVALVAALSLHTLFFMLLHNQQQTENIAEDAELLQISILTQNRPAQEVVTKKTVKNKVEKSPVEQQWLKKAVLSQPQTKQKEPADLKQTTYEKETIDVVAVLVPEHIQTSILARVSYPRRARRLGWEGEAELHFYISSHVVQDISVFLSAGFPTLDKAAFQALASITSLPLDDGRYRLPVVFQLQ